MKINVVKLLKNAVTRPVIKVRKQSGRQAKFWMEGWVRRIFRCEESGHGRRMHFRICMAEPLEVRALLSSVSLTTDEVAPGFVDSGSAEEVAPVTQSQNVVESGVFHASQAPVSASITLSNETYPAVERLFNPQTKPTPKTDLHFFTQDLGEARILVDTYGYHDEGSAFILVNEERGGTVELHRLYNTYTGEHYYTASREEADFLTALPKGIGPDGTPTGWNYEGTMGRIFSDPGEGRVQLRLLYNTEMGGHIYTTDPLEVAAIEAAHTGIWVEHHYVGYTVASDSSDFNFTLTANQSGTVNPGQTVSFTGTISNRGPAANVAVVHFTVPVNTTFVAQPGMTVSNGIVTWTTQGEVPVNGSISKDFSFRVNSNAASGPVSVTAGVDTHNDVYAADNTVTLPNAFTIANVVPQPGTADVVPGLSFSLQTLNPGDFQDIAVTMRNNGTATLTQPSVTVTLPPELTGIIVDTRVATLNDHTVTFNAASLAGGSSLATTVRASVAPTATAGVKTVSAHASASNNSVTGNDSVSKSFTVNAVAVPATPDLSLAFSLSPSNVDQGDDVTATIVVRTDLFVADSFVKMPKQAGVTLGAHDTNVTETSTHYIIHTGLVGVGTSGQAKVSFTLHVNADATPGQFTFVPVITTANGNPDNDSQARTLTVHELVVPPVTRDLSLSATASLQTALPGDQVTYSITVTNESDTDEPSAQVSVADKSELTYVSGGTHANGMTLINFGIIPTHTSVTKNFVEKLNSNVTDGTIVTINPKIITENDNVTNDADSVSFTVVIPTPPVVTRDLGLSASFDTANGHPNDTVSYSITVSNNSDTDEPAATVSITDTVGLAYKSGGTHANGKTVVNVGAVPAHGSVTKSVLYTVSANATNNQQLTLGSVITSTNDNVLNDTASGTLIVVVTPPVVTRDLSLSAVFDQANAHPGDGVSYSVTVTNESDSDESSAQVSVADVNGLTYVSGGTHANGTTVITVGAVPAHGSVTKSVLYTVSSTAQDGDELTLNSVIITTNDNAQNDAASATLPIVDSVPQEADLVLKVAGNSVAVPGALYSPAMKLRNDGNILAQDVKVKVTIISTDMVEFVSAEDSDVQQDPNNPNVILWDPLFVGAVQADGTQEILTRGLTFRFLTSATGTVEIDFAVTQSTPEKNPADNSVKWFVGLSGNPPVTAALAQTAPVVNPLDAAIMAFVGIDSNDPFNKKTAA